ncbi:MAG TPA: AzlD domain-containing protein [Candidatus Limnocylindria bacterium]
MIWLAIGGAGLATYLLRALPLALRSSRPVPRRLARYLDVLPTAMIAALVGPGLVVPHGEVTHGAEPLAALVVIAVVAWRRNLLAGVLSGVAAVAALRVLGLG